MIKSIILFACAVGTSCFVCTVIFSFVVRSGVPLYLFSQLDIYALVFFRRTYSHNASRVFFFNCFHTCDGDVSGQLRLNSGVDVPNVRPAPGEARYIVKANVFK